MPKSTRKARKTKATKKLGARRGRPPAGTPSKSAQIRDLLKTGMAPMDIAKKVGATPGLVYQIRGRSTGGKKAGKRRGPGRPRKSGGTPDGMAGVLDAVRAAEQERAAMRKALEQMRDLVNAALA